MPARLDGAGRVAAGLGLLYFALTTALTWAEHWTYNSTSLDMAVYTQLVWNIAHGHPFETTLLLQNRLHLAEHLAFLLLPLAPVYGVLPRVELLLALQQAALALSGWPVYWFARCRLGARLGLVVLSGYYAMPTLAEVALDAIYPVVFAAVPLGWAAAFALAGRTRSATVAALLGVLFEEEAALVAVGIALYLLLRWPGARRVGLALLVAGGGWLALGEAVAMPRYHQPSTAGEESRAEDHFGELRSQPLEWIGYVALNRLEPDGLRASGLFRGRNQPEVCSDPGHCAALRWWLYPTGGLALLSPTTLIMAAPEAAALLLADKPGRFRRHWAAPMLPVIWLAAAAGLARLGRWPRGAAVGVAGLVLAGVAVYYLDSPLPPGTQYEADDVVPTALGSDLGRLASAIPDGASVAATRRGLAHLANRRELYAFPPKDYGPGLWPPAELPEYALLDLRNRDTTAELSAPGGMIRPGAAYVEQERTANALLLRRSGTDR